MQDKIRSAVAAKVMAKSLSSLSGLALAQSWGIVQSSLDSATDAQKAKVILAISGRNTQRIGNVIGKLVRDHMKVLADAKADDMLADGSLNIAELGKILN